MNTKKILAYTSVTILAVMITIPVVFSDSDDHWNKYRQKSVGVAVIDNSLYQEECGSCHMAYQAGLLSSQSWIKVMNNLQKHFGDNAELDQDIQKNISDHLLANSAEKSNYRRSRKFMRNLDLNNAPSRITKTPYFIHKHDDVPDKLVTKNQQVKSYSNCNACHTKAKQGLFDDDNVRIPGYGRWDD